MPQTQAWRRAFARMGLKPTQYRCASEALLRRYKKEGALPAIHPLVDLCNAISMAYAIPVAVLDAGRVIGSIEVRCADGSENYLAFSGEIEHPYAAEVIFADDAGNAHARRWTNRQSALSAVSRGDDNGADRRRGHARVGGRRRGRAHRHHRRGSGRGMAGRGPDGSAERGPACVPRRRGGLSLPAACCE